MKIEEWIAREQSSDYQTWLEPYVDLIRCEYCINHSERTGRCDVWGAVTNNDGYCHRGKEK